MSLKEDIKRFPSLDFNNSNDLEHIQKYDIWYNFFSFWVFAWLILYNLKIIKIQPSLLFYYFAIIYIIVKFIYLNYYKVKTKHINIVILLIQVSIGFIVDVLPIFYLSSNNLFNINEYGYMILLMLIYLITIKIRFIDENLIETLIRIYLIYNDSFTYKNITLRKYIKIKFNI